MKLKLNLVIACAAVSMVCGTAAQQVSDAAEEGGVIGLPLIGDEAVAFLESASVVGEPENFDPVAITGPVRVCLSDGERTVRAVFKDENTLYREFRFGDGREVEKLEDSYRHEIAAFELDRLLGLGLVPPCVERKLLGRKGSLCLWIEASRPENERRDEGMVPPDEEAYGNQIREIRLFQQLIGDLDFSNIRNIVIDDNFRAYKIDSSLAFDTDTGLIARLDALTYSHRLIEALKTLDRAELDAALEPWLSKRERKALWSRRSKILGQANALIAERGEGAVLY